MAKGNNFRNALGRQFYKAASGAAQGFQKYAPAIFKGVKVAQQLRYPQGYSPTMTKNPNKKNKKRGSPGVRGKFVGPFKRKRKVRKNMYLAKGVEHTIEINGRVEDPDCVYIGHTTHSPVLLIEIICQTLLRKLFTKAGHVLTSIYQTIEGVATGFGNTDNTWLIRVVRIDKATGVEDNFDHVTVVGASTSLHLLCGDVSAGVGPQFADMINVFKEYANGANGTSASNTKVPFKVQLFKKEIYQIIPDIIGVWQFVTEIVLSEETIHVCSVSELKIQNRTVSADGNTSTDNVSNNPIEGRKYAFRNGAPYSRVEDAQLLEIFAATTGAITVRAAQLVGSALGLAEPPDPNIFSNCSGSVKVRLDPGHIKFDKIRHKVSKNILAFLISFGYGVGATSKYNRIMGKSSILAFEDVINVNTNFSIAVAYEINRKYGCYLTTHRAKPLLGSRFQMTQNGIP